MVLNLVLFKNIDTDESADMLSVCIIFPVILDDCAIDVVENIERRIAIIVDFFTLFLFRLIINKTFCRCKYMLFRININKKDKQFFNF